MHAWQIDQNPVPVFVLQMASVLHFQSASSDQQFFQGLKFRIRRFGLFLAPFRLSEETLSGNDQVGDTTQQMLPVTVQAQQVRIV